tara:strand:- start:120 stop:320 length:201 start_codon:yes stop_codon:yes gene_type:complete
MKALKSTKAEIAVTKKILEDWGCLDNLTESEKKRIDWQLNRIASEAVNDVKNQMNSECQTLYNSLT